MRDERDIAATAPRSGEEKPAAQTGAKTPRTARGERTLRALLNAAAKEFGERGFHEGSISGITSRAGVALGTFYTYFDSKDAIFRALVTDMSSRVRDHVAPAIAAAPDPLTAERSALAAFLAFARANKEIYRIIDEAEFVDSASFRSHYQTTAQRILARLRTAADQGQVREDINEVHAWAIMGMNVFLGLRFGLWDETSPTDEVAAIANEMVVNGIRPR
jgi:AcrR family transcriptional regulator